MKILKTGPVINQEIKPVLKNITEKNTDIKTEPKAAYSLEHLKSNFLPSFGAFKKVGETYVTDKKTGEKIPATIKKEVIGDFITFELYVGKQEAGFLDLICDTEDNNTPKVQHLQSILGDKYYGIGTALIKTAIQESYNCGGSGDLSLTAQTGYNPNLTSYRTNQSPIPFYYKLGFEATDSKVDEDIKNNLKKFNYDSMPYSAKLSLNPASRNYWLEELASNPIIRFKNQYPPL